MVARSLSASLALSLVVFPGRAVAAEDPLTGDVFVRFQGRGSAPAGILGDLSRRVGVLRIEALAGRWPAVLVHLAAGEDPLRVAAEIDALPGVVFAEADRWITTRALGPQDEPYFVRQWHLENLAQNEGALPGADVDAGWAWELAGGGEGIRIAVLDSGVQMDHPDLLLDLEGAWDAVDGDNDPSPDPNEGGGGHGTCVAGLAAARGDNGLGVSGVAWKATILPVRMIGSLSLSATRNAFVRATDAGADVLNNSWGMNDAECNPLPEYQTLHDGVDYAALEGRGGLGAVVLFATGNDGCRSTVYPLLANEHVLGVGSSNDRDEKWPYSVWGPNLDVLAPSGSVGGQERPGLWTTDVVGDFGWNGAGEDNDYTPWFGGTSGATPVAAGVVALMLAVNPRIDETSVRRLLCDTAVRVAPDVADYDSSGWSDTHGCGRIDAAAAVAAAVNEAPPAPVLVRPLPNDAVLLGEADAAWENAADPDGDVLSWELELKEAGEDDEDSAVFTTDRPGFTLDGEIERGDWELRVWAVDLWGRGGGTDWVPFRVEEAPEPTPLVDDDEGEGCACRSPGLPGSGGVFAAIGLLSVLILRRRAPWAALLLAACPGPADDDSAIPTPTPVCGDGVQAGDEGCDDENPWYGDGCAPSCVAQLRLGEAEPNDAPDTAGPLDGQGMILGSVPTGDTDCFRVQLAQGGWVEARGGPPEAGGDCPPVQLDLHDAEGNLLAVGTRLAADQCAAIDPSSAPGARFVIGGGWAVCVRGLSGAVVPGYDLQVESGIDSCLLPGLPFPSDQDVDLDGAADRCDDDDDGDGLPDIDDPCPHDANGGAVLDLRPDNEGFLREWLLAGPFVGAPTTLDCRPSDELLLGDDPQHVPALAGPAGTLAWAHYRAPGARVDYLAVMAGDIPREVYAALWFRSATTRPLQLALGPDDGARAWIDETEILDISGCQGTNVDQWKAPWVADTSWHRLLIKVRDQGGAWGAFTRFLDEAGAPVTDLEISLAAGGPWAPGPADTDGDGLGDVCDPSPAGG